MADINLQDIYGGVGGMSAQVIKNKDDIAAMKPKLDAAYSPTNKPTPATLGALNKAGDTTTGNLNIGIGTYLGFPATDYSGSKIWTEGKNAYGADMYVMSGGNVTILGGEGANNPTAKAELSALSDENVNIAADGSFNIFTGTNTWANRKLTKIDTNGTLTTGNVWANKGDATEPKSGVQRAGRTLYMFDNGSNLGLYSTGVGAFSNSYIIRREVASGAIRVGSSGFPLYLDGPVEPFAISGKILSNQFTTANKQLLNANTSNGVFVGNPEATNVSLETKDGQAFVNAGSAKHRIYHQGFKPTSSDVGLGNVPNTVHSANADANTVVVRDGSGDVNCRLLRSNYANQTSISGAMAFRINNSSDNYTRFCSDKVAIANWMEVVKRSEVNFGQTGTWAGVVGKIPIVGNNGAMEIGKFIDFHDTNSTKDYDVRLQANSNSLNITTGSGTIEIGVQNTSYAHIYTDRAKFAFNKEIDLLNNPLRTGYMVVAGDVELQAQSIRRHYKFNIGSRSLHMYADPNVAEFKFDASILSDGNGNFSDVYIRSDRRLKSNFKRIKNPLYKINQLNGLTYDKKGSDKREAGLIAQELQKVLPEAVNTNEDGMLSISSSNVIGLLVEGIKAQQKQINELKLMLSK